MKNTFSTIDRHNLGIFLVPVHIWHMSAVRRSTVVAHHILHHSYNYIPNRMANCAGLTLGHYPGDVTQPQRSLSINRHPVFSNSYIEYNCVCCNVDCAAVATSGKRR